MRTPKTLALLAVLFPAHALASAYDVPNASARDLSMAASAVAAQVDAAATFANPAALARLQGWSLALSGAGILRSTDWRDPAGTLSPPTSSTETKLSTPVSLFGSYGFDLAGYRAGVGFGMANPAGSAVSWPEDWAGRGRIINVDRKVFGFYLNGGFEVFDWLRLGGGAIYYYADQYLKQGVQPIPDAFAELSAKGGGFSFAAAAEVGPFGGLPLTGAVAVKYRATMKLEGDAHFQVPPALQPSVQDQGVKQDLDYPTQIDVGLSYRIVPKLLLTAGFTYTVWSIYDEDRFVGSKGLTVVVPRNYDDGQTYRLGLEWETTPALTLRAGVLRDVSGLNTDYYSPTLPDASSWVGAGGLGYRITPSFTANGTVYYAKRDQVTATGTTALPGVYDTNVWIFSLGVSWRMAPAPAP